MGLVNAHLHERKMKLLAIFTSSMRFCYNRGGVRKILIMKNINTRLMEKDT